MLNFDFSFIERIQSLGQRLIDFIPQLMLGIALFFIVKVSSKVLLRPTKKLILKNPKLKEEKDTILFLLNIGSTIFSVLIAFLAIFPSFSVVELVSLLGFGGIAMGFALRDILQNFMAGIIILFTDPFKLKDVVEISGFKGTVEKINIRNTVLKTEDNKIVNIPNTVVFNQAVVVIPKKKDS